MTNIIILDSGVRQNHPLLHRKDIGGYSLQFDDENNNVIRRDNFEDENGHGTAVYNIIQKKVKTAEIKMVKIFNKDLFMSEESLVPILEYIEANETPDILNMSFGITISTQLGKLYEICCKIQNKGTIIVSAFDNAGAISYPAAFDCVIGVDTIDDISKETEYDFVTDTCVNIMGKGTPSRLAWLAPDYIITNGSSFTCACISGMIGNWFENNECDKSNIMEQLKKEARCVYEIAKNPYSNAKPKFCIQKAAVFPFNKEMHSLIRFSDMLSFEISHVYDVKYSARVGAKTNRLLGQTDGRNYTVEDIHEIVWEDFDTLILGHMDELSALIRKSEPNMRNNIISQALENDINIYSFDLIEKDLIGSKQDFVYSPRIGKNDLPPYRFGKLEKIAKPVLGVFGTSARQGKFTLQMMLRQAFIEKGYRVGQLGSEPSSLLYGFDEVYPFGYNGTVDVYDYDAIIHLNSQMGKISEKDYDIILVGSQSGTVPYDIGNIVQFPMGQITFLYGTCPDAVILNVNPHDDIDYVERTIKFIEGAVNCKVIALCLFPMILKEGFAGLSGAKEKLDINAGEQLKQTLTNTFQIPTITLGEKKEVSMLIEVIEDFFGG